MGREAEGVNRDGSSPQAGKGGGADLPAHFTWTSVRPHGDRVRERERDSETDT